MTAEQSMISEQSVVASTAPDLGVEDWHDLTSPRALFKTRFDDLFVGEIAVRLGQSDLGTCFVAALVAQGWIGSARHLAEALPAGKEPLDITDV